MLRKLTFHDRIPGIVLTAQMKPKQYYFNVLLLLFIMFHILYVICS